MENFYPPLWPRRVSGKASSGQASTILMGARETENLNCRPSHATGVFIRLDHLTHNMRLLQDLVGHRPLWPAIKANAYGHGAEIVGCHLVRLGYNR